MSNEYYTWLQQPIDWKGVGIVPRCAAIRAFVAKGLRPFLAQLGYKISISDELLQSRIASGLFDNQGTSHIQSNWSYGKEMGPHSQEEVYHYSHVVDSAAWDTFWFEWGSWADVSLEDGGERGQDRRYDIEAFIWSQIDLDASPQTKIIMDFLRFDEFSVAQEAARREDTYLREAAESGQFEGKRR